MYKYMKIVAIVVMVVMAGVSSPAIGQAAAKIYGPGLEETASAKY